MIKISISSDVVFSGKTTLAIELAKFLSEKTGNPVNILSDTIQEVLLDKFHTDNSLEGLDIQILDLNGNSEESYETVAVLSVGKKED